MSELEEFKNNRVCISKIGGWVFCIIPIHLQYRKEDFDIFFKQDEKNYIDNIYFLKRRHEWQAGRIAAKFAFRELCKSVNQTIPKLTEILIRNSKSSENYGQPEVNIKGYISISHCQEYAVGVASSHLIGVDIEKVRSFSTEVQKMMLTSEEFDWFNRIENSKAVNKKMTIAWSFKEAFMKMHGQSIFGWLNDIQLTGIHPNNELTWKITPRLSRKIVSKENYPIKAIGSISNDYAIVIVGELRPNYTHITHNYCENELGNTNYVSSI